MSAVVTEQARPEPAARPAPAPPPRDIAGLVLRAGAVILVLVGVGLRFWTRSPLWLDEALTVNISRLPVADIPAALRHDGAPPLFYLLLHAWVRVFGTGNLAVRSLPAVFSVATLPAAWLAAKRLGGRRAAWATVVLLATNPFAIRYASECRMYSLVALEVVLGLLALRAVLDEPRPWRMVALAACTAALLYTHYWALYLLASVALVLVVRAVVGEPHRRRRPARLALVAMATGGVTWLPWVPTFLYQSAHTGTPWAVPVGPSALISLITEYSGGAADGHRTLGLILAVLVLLGLFGRAGGNREVTLDLRTRPAARHLALVLVLTPSLAIAAGLVSKSAFVARYTSVVFPLFVLLAGLGAAVLVERRVFVSVLAVACLLGLALGYHTEATPRTQAGVLATYLTTTAKPGDVVAYCPDQLGPAVNRLIGDRFYQTTFPRGTPPQFVNWVDYQDVNKAASPAAFAQQLVDRAGAGHAVWLVSSHGYRTAVKTCTQLEQRLGALRPDGRQVVAARPGKYFEDASLISYPAS